MYSTKCYQISDMPEDVSAPAKTLRVQWASKQVKSLGCKCALVGAGVDAQKMSNFRLFEENWSWKVSKRSHNLEIRLESNSFQS